MEIPTGKLYTAAEAARLSPEHRRKLIQAGQVTPLQMLTRKVHRNDPCPCGSGRKFKKCCRLKTP